MIIAITMLVCIYIYIAGASRSLPELPEVSLFSKLVQTGSRPLVSVSRSSELVHSELVHFVLQSFRARLSGMRSSFICTDMIDLLYSRYATFLTVVLGLLWSFLLVLGRSVFRIFQTSSCCSWKTILIFHNFQKIIFWGLSLNIFLDLFSIFERSENQKLFWNRKTWPLSFQVRWISLINHPSSRFHRKSTIICKLH